MNLGNNDNEIFKISLTTKSNQDNNSNNDNSNEDNNNNNNDFVFDENMRHNKDYIFNSYKLDQIPKEIIIQPSNPGIQIKPNIISLRYYFLHQNSFFN